MSLFRYGLDYVQMAIQRLIGFGKKEEFKEILAILRRQKPDRIRVLWNLSCTETQKLRSLYAHQVRVAELFLKIGEVSNLTPLILTGNKTVFSFKETGKSLTKIKKEISSVKSTSQADEVLADIISELV